MRKSFTLLFVPTILIFFKTALFATAANSVTIEAEAGTLGRDFKTVDTLGVTCVTVRTDIVNSGNPGNSKRMITYQVTFPDSGTYDLYAHLMVGPNGYNDDSYFYGNGFGLKDSALNSDWILANGLDPVGYTVSNALVYGAGGSSIQVWKWLDMSKFNGGAAPITFKVTLDSLTKTFQIGGRENGLYIDKFVFGKTGYYFTVDNLNKGQSGSALPPGQKPTTPPIGKGKAKFLGSEYDNIQAPRFNSYWNQLTPGNAGKWGTIEGTRGTFVWTDLDTAYNYAKKNHFLFKMHNLIWGQQQPSWISTLDSATQRQEIVKWFAAMAARYDSIDFIDVVNEPINTPPDGSGSPANANYIKALGGKGTTGWDWVITSYRLARQYFPKSKLLINEYNVENNSTRTQTYIQIVQLLLKDTLIDGIGLQAHDFTTSGTPSTTLKANIDALATIGLPIYASEMEIDGATDYSQVQEYMRVFPIYWTHPALKGLTFWGYRYGLWRQAEMAYVITNQDVERPALTWLKAYVQDTLVNAQTITIADTLSRTTITSLTDSLKMLAKILPANTTIPMVKWSVSPYSLAKISSNGVLKPLANGTVTVTGTAWDSAKVSGSVNITISNVVSIANNSISDISVFPNPSENGFFTITGIEKIRQINISGIDGRLVKKFSILNQSSLIIKLDVKPGIYLIKLTDGEQCTVKKVMIK